MTFYSTGLSYIPSNDLEGQVQVLNFFKFSGLPMCMGVDTPALTSKLRSPLIPVTKPRPPVGPGDRCASGKGKLAYPQDELEEDAGSPGKWGQGCLDKESQGLDTQHEV